MKNVLNLKLICPGTVCSDHRFTCIFLFKDVKSEAETNYSNNLSSPAMQIMHLKTVCRLSKATAACKCLRQ